MKNFRQITLLFTLFTFIGFCSFAQKVKNSTLKTAKEIDKEAKSLKKDGWDVAEGKLPLNKQLERSYAKQLEQDENGNDKWITSTAAGVDKKQKVAMKKATAAARQQLVQQLESQVDVLINTSLASESYSEEEINTLDNFAEEGTSYASVNTPTDDLLLLYNYNKKTKVWKCQTTIGWNTEIAKNMALEGIRNSLKETSKNLRDKLDKKINDN